MVGRLTVTALAVVTLVAGAAWYHRAAIEAYINPPVSSGSPAEKPDVLYSWVDENGVTHFSAEPGKSRAQRVEYDGSRITPVEAVNEPVLPSAPAEGGTEASSGNALVDLRKEMERKARAMSESKAAQHDF